MSESDALFRVMTPGGSEFSEVTNYDNQLALVIILLRNNFVFT